MRCRLSILIGFFILGAFGRVFAAPGDDAYQAGVSLYKNAQYEQAIAQLNQALLLNANYWQAYQVIGYCYSLENNNTAALNAYNQCLAINPNNPTVQEKINLLKMSINPTPTATITGENLQQFLPVKNSFYFGLGGSTGVEPDGFSQNWTTGGSAGIGVGFGLSPLFSFVIDSNYSSFTIQSTRSADPGITFSGGPLQSSTLLGNFKFKFIAQDNPVLPYLIFGMGAANVQSNPIVATNGVTTVSGPSVNELDFAFRFGIGLDIKLSPGTYLTLESNGVEILTSNTVSSEGYMAYNMSHLGMKLDL